MTPKEKAKELYDFNWNWLYTSADYTKTVLDNCCKVMALNLCNEILREHEAHKPSWTSIDNDRFKFWYAVKMELLSLT